MGAALLLIAFTTPAARANHIDTAQVTQLTCDSFTITLSASELNPGQNYEIDFAVSVTSSGLMPISRRTEYLSLVQRSTSVVQPLPPARSRRTG